MPATSAAGSDCIRASTAAVSAISSRCGPKLSPELKPRVGWVRMAVNAATAPASPQANELMRDENTPAIRAASGLAADPRIARPKRENFRKAPMARTTNGDRKSIPAYAGVTFSAPIVNDGSPGGSGYRAPAPAWLLIAKANSTRNWPTPSVATTDITLGALRNRRTTASSASAPTPAVTSSAGSSASQYGTCQFTTAMPNTAAPNAPT